jgi:tRNA(fMet)-specific endonuclease VapC
MKALLDTSICVHVIRQRSRAVLDRFASFEPGDLAISSITAAELYFGVEKSPHRDQDAQALAVFLAGLAIHNFNEDAAVAFGKIRYFLQKGGTPIGAADLFIAAHAVSLGVPIITDNVREFARVPGLTVLNWVER